MTVKKYDGCRIKNKSGKEKDDVRQGETENMNKTTKKKTWENPGRQSPHKAEWDEERGSTQ